MRILFCCLGDFMGPPGTRQTLLLCRALEDAGHRCLLLLEGAPDTVRLVSPKEVGNLPIGRYEFRGPLLSRKTLGRAAAFGPDLVHCYEPRTAPLAAALAIARHERVPLCVRFADDDEMLRREAGGSGLRGALGRPTMLAVGTVFPNRWAFQHPLHHRRMLRAAAGYDAITPALAEEISRRYGVWCEPILPALPPQPPDAPRAVDVRTHLGLPATVPLLLYAGSIFRAQFEDFALLLRAFDAVVQRRPDVVLVHTGRLASRYREADIRALAGAGAERVRFMGFLEDPGDLTALMAEASALVQPGAPTEFNRLRLPAKVHDYLLAGRPVVTFSVGFGELLKDREQAALTRSGRPEELASTIEWLLADPSRADAIGEAGRQRALELFAPDAIARQTLAYYERALTS